MKILYISRRFYPEVIGGGQISGFYIAKSQVMQGNDVHVVTFSDKEDKDVKIDGVNIHVRKIPKLRYFPRLSNMDYMYIQMARLSSKFIKKIKPDVIHLLNGESIPLSAIYYKLKFRVPIVATMNGPNLGCFTQSGIDYKGDTCIDCKVLKRYRCSARNWGSVKGFFYYLYSLWYMPMLRFSYRYVDRFLAVSSAMIPLLENMGVSKNRVSVIHNPVKINKAGKSGLKKELGIVGKKVVLFAGRLAETKGVQFTIRAMEHVEGSVLLIVGGKRDYYENLLKLVKELKLEKKVIFIGNVENSKMGEYYSIADVAILSQTIYESFSRFLLEACSYGVPIVASDVGGNSDIVRDGYNGLLIKGHDKKNIADAISKIISSGTLQSKMGGNSLKFAKTCSLDNIGSQINEEYARIIKKFVNQK